MSARLPDRPLAVFGCTFVVLLLANALHVADPPYWDGVIGLYTQAAWLARNDFDYAALAAQPSYWVGGANLHYFSLLAPLAAALWRLVGVGPAFVLLHLATLAIAAVTVTATHRFLRDVVGLVAALLWCAAATFDPIWSGQVATIYTEVPVAACGVLAISAVWRRWWLAAGALLVAGFVAKQTIVILALAVWVWLPLDAIVGWGLGPSRWRDRLALLAPAPLLLVASRWNEFGLGIDGTADMGLLALVEHWLERGWFYFPWWLAWLGTIASAVVIVASSPSLRARIDGRNRLLAALLCVVVAAFWASYVVASWPLPRYGCFVLFPTFALLAILSRAIDEAGSLALGTAILVLGIVNQDGLLLPALQNPAETRSGYRLERSRAYLDDLAGNRAICAFLETHHFDATIVAKPPFTYLLTLPELGYVSRALPHVVGIGRVPLFAGVRALGPDTVLPPDALFVYAPNVFERNLAPHLEPEAGNVVVEDDRLGGRVVVYRRR